MKTLTRHHDSVRAVVNESEVQSDLAYSKRGRGSAASTGIDDKAGTGADLSASAGGDSISIHDALLLEELGKPPKEASGPSFLESLSEEERRTLALEAAESVTRVEFLEDPGQAGWLEPSQQSPYHILPFVEFKTAWHPMGF